YLKEGAIVTDTATLKHQVLEWAAQYLPETVSFVGGDPILSPEQSAAVGKGTEGASATLLKDAQYCLTPSAKAATSAVQVVADMVTTMGAQPYFLDAMEHDGLMAHVDHLPATLGAALLDTAVAAPSWGGMRRLAGEVFAHTSGALGNDSAAAASTMLGNADNLLRVIGHYQERLEGLRQMLEARDEEALKKLLDDLLKERDRWASDRLKANWDERTPAEIPTAGSYFGSLFGMGGGFGRRKREEEKDQERKGKGRGR
ncbi:MAG: prephenate dehydrogenase/arogenate dehydrogenase family protein, partial [Chloroflexi bacterium]|nr:prephenate dehydrogenase/arogenate dehydrogenase family protein [Chloroflexota bacterium]